MADSYLTIIGGGVIGNAIAYELSKTFSGSEMFLLDKNRSIPGDNQSARNLGVNHAGIHYDQLQSPLKARFCVKGNRLLYEFCREFEVPARMTGKLIAATNEKEDLSLDQLLFRSRENGVPGVRKISGNQVRDLEPNVKAYSALFVPTSGIIEPSALIRKLKFLAKNKGLEYLEATTVTDIQPTAEEFIVKAKRSAGDEFEFTTRFLVNAAGLDSDLIARMVNPDFPYKIFPVRGEAAKFYQRSNRPELAISHNVYPVPIFYQKPDDSFHLTVGVHLTPTFDADANGDYKIENKEYCFGKTVTVGPLNRKRGEELLGKEDFCSDLAEPKEFYENIKNYFPGIAEQDLELHQAGIQAVLANSQDFVIEKDQKYPNLINLVGICSPGLTSSLAIAKYVSQLFIEQSTPLFQDRCRDTLF